MRLFKYGVVVFRSSEFVIFEDIVGLGRGYLGGFRIVLIYVFYEVDVKVGFDVLEIYWGNGVEVREGWESY